MAAHEPADDQRQTPSFSSTDHGSSSLAVFQVSVEPAFGARDVAETNVKLMPAELT